MTRAQMKWSGLLALILLVLVLDIWFNWRLFVLTLSLAIYVYSLGRSKPAVVRIVQYPPKKLTPQNCTRDVGHDGACNGWPCETAKKKMDLTPGRRR